MKYDAVVFDLDGTLWDATNTALIGWNNALQSLGFDKLLSISEIRSVTGKPTDECIRILLSNETKKNYNLIDKIKIHEKNIITEFGGEFYDDCCNLIKKLHTNYNLFIVSNCQKWYLDSFFNHSGCREYFLDFNCHGLSNKNKSVMLDLLKKKHKMKNPIYIGDAETDMIAAFEAGYDFIFAEYGFGNLIAPVKRINSLKDLLNILN